MPLTFVAECAGRNFAVGNRDGAIVSAHDANLQGSYAGGEINERTLSVVA
jgi:hypothetical protein